VTQGIRHPASFRDPSGFLFRRDGVLLRQVQPVYAQHYEQLMDSGLYAALVERDWLVPHEEAPLELAAEAGAFRVLRPELLPFISHPWEWSFGALRAAGLRTLDIQRLALDHGLSLKDASAHNIQLRGHRPVFIDTLSFEPYEEGRPWVAYRQFCQHFLAPLALAAWCDARLLDLLRVHLDGIPLDLAVRLLPWRTRLSPALYAHLHLHARFQRRHASDGREGGRGATAAKTAAVSRRGLDGILESLAGALRGFDWKLPSTEWGDYYSDTNYDDEAFAAKRALVAAAIEATAPSLVFDLGANRGDFSRLASERGAFAVAFDVDAVAVEFGWRAVEEAGDERLLPLRLDLANPSPSLGWAHAERASLAERGPADLVLALALVHHLAIGNNVPLPDVARFLARLGRSLVIEFVPKEDSQVQRLLATREDVFAEYDRPHFEAAFALHFETVEVNAIPGTERVLYRLRRRAEPE
jgi:hypothetical protein